MISTLSLQTRRTLPAELRTWATLVSQGHAVPAAGGVMFNAAQELERMGMLLEAGGGRYWEGRKVQYMPMIGGILKKIRNSGELASISAQVAYQNDFFEYELGDDEKITHKPFLGADRGKPVAVYAIARTKDGAVYREVMSVPEVEKVRQASRAANAGPWVQWWDEMARKTVIRRIAKRLPSSADVDHIFDADNEASGFAQVERRAPVNVTPPPDEQIEPMSRLKRSIAEATVEPVDQVTGEILEGKADVAASDA